MRIARLTAGEALDTQVVVIAGTVCAPDAYLYALRQRSADSGNTGPTARPLFGEPFQNTYCRGDICGTHIADIFNTPFAASSSNFLSDDTHVVGTPTSYVRPVPVRWLATARRGCGG
jgi:hypothetical protein